MNRLRVEVDKPVEQAVCIITTLQVGLYSASRQEVDKAVSMSSVYYHNTTGWAVFSIQTGSRQSSEHEQCVLSQHYRLGCIQHPDRK